MIQVVLIEKIGNTRKRYNGEKNILRIERLNRPKELTNENFIELEKQVLFEIKKQNYPQSVHGFAIYDENDTMLCERYEFSRSVNEMSFLNK